MSIYDHNYTSIGGEEVSMADYKGKVLLIVNTASKCGFTPQYTGLQALYDEYKDQGLVVIGFPCNQFMGQEPAGEEEIAASCKLNYGVTFPLSKKVDIIGDAAIPLFKHLTSEKPFTGKLSLMLKMAAKSNKKIASENDVKWNFTKFLIGKDGAVAERFEPEIKPEDIAPAIEKLLA